MPKLKFNAATKSKAVLEVLRERKTANEIAKDFAVHPTQLSTWKTQALANFPSLFESPADKTSKDQLELVDELYRQIGQIQVELSFLKKKL